MAEILMRWDTLSFPAQVFVILFDLNRNASRTFFFSFFFLFSGFFPFPFSLLYSSLVFLFLFFFSSFYPQAELFLLIHSHIL